MKSIVRTLLTFLFFTPSFCQQVLDYKYGPKEKDFNIYSYNDGSFSLYTSPADLGAGTEAEFRSYSASGELVVELTGDEFIDILRINSSNNMIKNWKGFPWFKIGLPEMVDRDAKRIIRVGTISPQRLCCRILHYDGSIKDVVLDIGESGVGPLLNALNASLLDDNTVRVLFITRKKQLYQAVFDITRMKGEVSLINHLESTKHTNYRHYGFVGSDGNSLYCLSQNTKEQISYILKIAKDGSFKKIPFQFPESGGFQITQAPLINGNSADLFFCLRNSYTLTDLYLCRLSDANELTFIKVQIPQKDWYSSTSFPFLSIYESDTSSRIIYSYNGKNMIVFPFDIGSNEIGRADDRAFTSINIDEPQDFIPLIESLDKYPEILGKLLTCKRNTGSCYFKISSILHEDGTSGFVTIEGDVVPEKQYYTNIRITKY